MLRVKDPRRLPGEQTSSASESWTGTDLETGGIRFELRDTQRRLLLDHAASSSPTTPQQPTSIINLKVSVLPFW